MGGRYNLSGIPAVYAAANVSLAVLEVLVHLDRTEFPEDYVLMGIDLADSQITNYEPSERPYLGFAKTLVEKGQTYAIVGSAPVIQVPSVIIPREMNYVLYPAVPGLKARIEFIEPFAFDERLFQTIAAQ